MQFELGRDDLLHSASLPDVHTFVNSAKCVKMKEGPPMPRPPDKERRIPPHVSRAGDSCGGLLSGCAARTLSQFL
jgi:hypothetical protein